MAVHALARRGLHQRLDPRRILKHCGQQLRGKWGSVTPEARSAEDTETAGPPRLVDRQGMLHQRLDPRRILKQGDHVIRGHHGTQLHQRLDPRRILKLGVVVGTDDAGV